LHQYSEFAVSPESYHPVESASPQGEEGSASQPADQLPLDRTETDPDVVARLEWLDDLMFAAIDGDPISLQAAAESWHQALRELGGDTLEESRRQYLRRAQSVWNDLRTKPNHPPHKVFAAIEIISLLAGKAW
jgi:hypothetical protein